MTKLPESFRVQEHSDRREFAETPGKAKVLQWLQRTREKIERLLTRTKGPVRMQMSERAAQASGLAHQYVMIAQTEPREVRTADGQRLLASFKELEENESVQLQSADVA